MSEDTPTLKPCPFCQKDGTIVRPQIPGIIDGWFAPHCSDYKCVFGSPNRLFQTRAEAIAAWNTRASPWQDIETAPKDDPLKQIPCRVYGMAQPIMLSFHEDNGRRCWRDWDHEPHLPYAWVNLPIPGEGE